MKKIHAKKQISLLMSFVLLLLTVSVSFCAGAVSTYMVYLPSGDGYTVQAVEGYSIFNLERGSQFRFTLTLSEGYNQSEPEVYVNNLPIAENDGQYIVSDIQSDIEVTVENVKKNTYSVTLPDTPYCTFSPAPGYKENAVIHGSAFKFIMNLKDAYSQSTPVVYLNGTELVPGKNNAYSIENITSDISGITVSEVPLNTYTLNFFNEDGTFIWKTTANHGESVTYGGEIPVKASDSQWHYDFTGWSPTLGTAEGDASYTAAFAKRTRYYTVRFLNYDGSVIETYQVPYNGSAYCSVIPERPDDYSGGYTFKQFDVDTSVVTKDIDTTARFEHKHVFRHFLIEPTCTESGYTYDYCDSCGYGITYDHTYALGHQFGEWLTAVPATDTADGLKIRICSACGETEEQVIPMGTVDENAGSTEEPTEEKELRFFEKIIAFFKKLFEKIKALFVV